MDRRDQTLQANARTWAAWRGLGVGLIVLGLVAAAALGCDSALARPVAVGFGGVVVGSGLALLALGHARLVHNRVAIPAGQFHPAEAAVIAATGFIVLIALAALVVVAALAR
jgi:uncharacterized membrane protein YidH (DUF202 family)